MGAWGSAPWHNDAAADWFGDVFAGIDIDAHIADAFQYDDDYDRVRAACYLLAVLGHSAVWPGELERLDDHLERGIELLNDMVEPGSDFRELWEDECRSCWPLLQDYPEARGAPRRVTKMTMRRR